MTDPEKTTRILFKSFWATIVVIAGGTLALLGAALVQTRDVSKAPRQVVETPSFDPQIPDEIEIPGTVLQRIFVRASSQASEITIEMLDRILDSVFDPVYEAVPAYVNFHYSVRGQYTELFGASGIIESAIKRRVFDGFDERLDAAMNEIDLIFSQAFNRSVQDQLAAEIPVAWRGARMSEATQAVIRDAQYRMRYTLPVGSFVAATGGFASAKLAAAIAAKVATKVIAKTAVGVAVKGTGIGGGAATGAAIGAFLGPVGAGVGGVVGGAVAWFAVDSAIVLIDDLWNREEFENDLRGMIDEERHILRDILGAATHQKVEAAKNFTISERLEQ
ncbi:MAG: hypothetical protein JJU07_14115 [Natronohydrobacter sp.]|nr:hypothetical protein [Natronohydrobacter sp.]